MKKKGDRGRGERLEDANVVFRRRGRRGGGRWWTRYGVRSLEAAFHGSILGAERANGIHGSAHYAETLSAVVAYFNIAFKIVIDRDLSVDTRERASYPRARAATRNSKATIDH